MHEGNLASLQRQPQRRERARENERRNGDERAATRISLSPYIERMMMSSGKGVTRERKR